jgi:DNA-binding SARP family transcriptional activator
VYETFANAPRFDFLVQEAAYWVPTHRRLGELYEERGDREKALQYYNRFVEVWAGADAELQSQVEDVRERMARLVVEQR